jgi:hypothetical protein
MEILIHPQFKKQMTKEFDCSKQTVDMSLKYVFNSEKAIAIRNKTKELLKNEIKKIEKKELELLNQ